MVGLVAEGGAEAGPHGGDLAVEGFGDAVLGVSEEGAIGVGDEKGDLAPNKEEVRYALHDVDAITQVFKVALMGIC